MNVWEHAASAGPLAETLAGCSLEMCIYGGSPGLASVTLSETLVSSLTCQEPFVLSHDFPVGNYRKVSYSGSHFCAADLHCYHDDTNLVPS